MTELHNRCLVLLEELGLARSDDTLSVTPLLGGVASDIARVELNGQSYCVKFALPKLKVAVDWQVPVQRNAAEYAWLEVAARVCPQAAVKLFGRSSVQHGFVMEFLDGPDIYLWKSALLDCAEDSGEAGQVGDTLGQIHAASTSNSFDSRLFQNREDFLAIRIEPYLNYTAQFHPELQNYLNTIAEELFNNAQVLVHGDVSPKNILIRSAGPVLLDAECATMGDACFDPSFCLNHLILKAAHLPDSRSQLLSNVDHFWSAYSAHVSWESPAALEARICHLLPALMLARVDGKSPVEYLDEKMRDNVRKIAVELCLAPTSTLKELVQKLDVYLKEQVG